MKAEKQVIIETNLWKVFLTSDQRYLGRCLIFLKRECGSLSELTKEEALDFFEIAKKLETLLKKTFNATMFNWSCLMNDAFKTQPPKPQVHWHFRPRYNHPVEFSGKTFKDPNFGYHYLRVPEEEEVVSDEMLELIAAEIRRNIK